MDHTEINFIERSRSRPQSSIFIFAADLCSVRCARTRSVPVINRNTYHDLHIIASKFCIHKKYYLWIDYTTIVTFDVTVVTWISRHCPSLTNKVLELVSNLVVHSSKINFLHYISVTAVKCTIVPAQRNNI